MEVIRFEAHDVALGMEALQDGFGIDQLLVECRSGEEWVIPGNRPDYVSVSRCFAQQLAADGDPYSFVYAISPLSFPVTLTS